MRQIILASLVTLCLSAGSVLAQDAAPPPATPPADPATPVVMTGPRILIATSMGDITVQLDAVRAPRSVANILSYVKEKHYDGTVFYRVDKGFVIQMGSWDAMGEGRSMHPGPVPFEGDNGLRNLRGTLALGHGDAPDSAGPDFFINLVNNSALDANPAINVTGYAVFGQVTQGLDVVDAISQVPVGAGPGPMQASSPNAPVTVIKVTRLPD